MSFAILRTSKLKSFGEIGGSLSHTYRTRLTVNADSERTHLNEHSHSNTQSVKNDIAARLPEKRRSDAVLCIEHLITASPEWEGWNTDQEMAFFEKSKKWLEEKYGASNVIATSIHRDETTPHLVAYVVPVDANTGRLNAKKWLGGKYKLSQMQTDFANEVTSFGLKRGLERSKAEHKTIKKFYSELNGVEKSDIKPFENRPELPDKGFFENAETYKDKIEDIIYESFSNDLLQLRKENSDLRKKISDQEEQLNELLVIRYKLIDYWNYLKVFPAKQYKLNADFKNETDNELKRRDECRKRLNYFDDVYANFSLESSLFFEPVMQYLPEQKKEYAVQGSIGNAYRDVLNEKYDFINARLREKKFLENGAEQIFDLDLRLEDDKIAINARLIKETAEFNERVKTTFYEQDELRRRNEYINGRDRVMNVDENLYRNKRNRDFDM